MTNTNDAYKVTADELKQFVERYQQLDSEESDIKDQKKDLKAELKARGYDVKAFMAIIALMKADPDDVTEFEAVVEIYKQAVGLD